MAYAIDPEVCTACGACESECPNGAISHKKKLYTINPAKCTECDGAATKACVSVCENGSISPA